MRLSPSCFALVWVLAAAGLSLGATTDARFGFVGTGGKPMAQKFGLPYYALEGNYAVGPVFSSVDSLNDPPPGHKVLRKVAKLNVRNDGLGQSNAEFEAALGAYAAALATWNASLRLTSKPKFAWYEPDARALAAAESLHVIATIRREKTRNPQVTGTVWEIGNEPNLFPAISPARYAEVYARYHRFIKREDPSARVAIGPFFVRETGMDLVPLLRETLAAQLELRVRAQLTDVSTSVADVLAALVHADLWATVSSRILATGTVHYLDSVLAALDPSIRPDVVSLHVYPFDDRAPAQTQADVKRVLDSLALAIQGRLQARGATPPVWITEFGNIDPALGEDQAAAKASGLIDVFEANSRFGMWFYYKGTGFDMQLAGLPGISPPLTRLARDAEFNPLDGDFPCGRLNAIGRLYYLRATGSPCAEKAGFVGDSTRHAPGDGMLPVTLRVRLRRAEVDTVKLTVARKHGTIEAAQYSALPQTLVFAPGDTARDVTVTWKGAKSGDLTFVLRDAVNGGLGPDSLHTIVARFDEADPSALAARPGEAPKFKLAGSTLEILAPETMDFRVRVYDLSGHLLGTARKSVPAGGSRLSLDEIFLKAALRSGLHFVEVSVPAFDHATFHSWMRK
jgi:hypothetical protein